MDISEVISHFQDKFPTDLSCERYFHDLRWPQGFICPKCGGTKCWTIKQPIGYECAGCKRRISLTSDSLLAQTHLPLREWFGAAYLLCSQRNGISARKLQEIIGLGSYQTSWLVLNRLRYALSLMQTAKISGPVHCFYFWYTDGKDVFRSKNGRPIPRKTKRSIPILCLHQPFHQKGAGEFDRRRWLFFKVLPELDLGQLEEFLKNHTNSDATLMIEDQQREFFNRQSIRQVNLVDLQQRLEIRLLLRRLRTWLNNVHGGIQRKYLQEYLHEFTFHINFPGTLDERFDRLMKIAASRSRAKPVQIKPPPSKRACAHQGSRTVAAGG